MKKFFGILFFLPVLLNAQNMLLPEDAVSIGLKNNFDILVAKNNAASDSILNAPGQAGMLPSLTLNANAGINRNNIHQVYSNGNDIRATNAGSDNFAPNVALSWTVFDGMKMFITKEKLATIGLLGEYQLRAQVLTTTSDILIAYYDVVQQKQQLAATNEIIKYNEQRVTITDAKFQTGLGPKTDLLQAKIDLNVEQENRVAQLLAIDEAKHKLNNLLARDINTTFDVPDSIAMTTLADRKAIEQKMLAANPVLLAMKTQVDVSKLALRETYAQRFPKITLNAGYNFSRTENTAGFSLFNQAYGWQTGVTLSMPLYLGGAAKRQSALARLDIQTSQFEFQQATINASYLLYNALSAYDAQVQQLELEKENEAMARENMQLALDRLRLGQGTALDVALAQSTLAASLSRMADISYAMKLAEINVRMQSADL